MVMVTQKTFKMRKENNCLNRRLTTMEKNITKSEEAHKSLLEAFERAKELNKKTEVKLMRTKLEIK